MTTKTCAGCDELIDSSAKICPECGHAPRKAFALLGIGVIMFGSLLTWVGILVFFPLFLLGAVVAVVGLAALLASPFVKATTGGSKTESTESVIEA